MRPYNTIALEAVMHDALADGFAKASLKHPKAAKLGAIPVALITLATKPLFTLATLVESTAFFVLNLFGSIFSSKCRKDLGESCVNLLFNIVNTALCGLITLAQAVDRAVQLSTDPVLYKSKTNFHKNSVLALRNDQASLPVINPAPNPTASIIQKITGNSPIAPHDQKELEKVPANLWKEYDKWLDTQSGRSPIPVAKEFLKHVGMNTWNKIQAIIDQRQQDRIRQVVLKPGTGPLDQVD